MSCQYFLLHTLSMGAKLVLYTIFFLALFNQSLAQTRFSFQYYDGEEEEGGDGCNNNIPSAGCLADCFHKNKDSVCIGSNCVCSSKAGNKRLGNYRLRNKKSGNNNNRPGNIYRRRNYGPSPWKRPGRKPILQAPKRKPGVKPGFRFRPKRRPGLRPSFRPLKPLCILCIG